MTLEEYQIELNNHDWFYGMSEDNTIYRRGQHNQDRLSELSKLSPEHKAAYLKIKEEKYKQILG
jgi:hypothetical protein